MVCIPRKSFGQNFLQDRSVIKKIIEAIAILPDDQLVEIGPGLGALTMEMLPLVKELHAVELDKKLVPVLSAKCKNLGELKIHEQDVLRFDFSSIFQGKPLRIIGNLPYNISTQLLIHLLKFVDIIKDMHFMLQLEVAERLAAGPGSKVYGRLSVVVQYYFNVSLLFTVSPKSFYPAPKVNSAFVCLTPKQKRQVTAVNLEVFLSVVREAFCMRRKTIHNSLKRFVTDEMLVGIKIDPGLRPEQLAVDDFVRISNLAK